MKVAMIGVGYVGLVSGTGFSEMGNQVMCVDVDEKKIANLKKGKIPIHEPGLTEIVMSNQRAERLYFTTDLNSAVKKSDILFIAVGTPSDIDGQADLSYILRVAEDIGKYINDYKVVVVKSTVPVGSGKKVQKIIATQLQKRGENIEFDVVSNPEFLKEGTAFKDFMRPDRIVVGVESEKAKKTIEQLYAPFIRNGHPLLIMDLASSEMTKYAANAMLATKISFMNEISRLCEQVGADIQNVRRGIGTDIRIGFHFIYAGLGYGGSCFPKDIKALLKTGQHYKEEMAVLNAVEEVNHTQRLRFVQTILNYFSKFNKDLREQRFALWGLAFKPGTDDIREAPSIDLIQALLDQGAEVVAYDPVAIKNTKERMGNHPRLSYTSQPYPALDGADALILATEWREFREPDFDQMKQRMNSPCIFDGRNQYDLKVMEEKGFNYISVGRKTVEPITTPYNKFFNDGVHKEIPTQTEGPFFPSPNP